jgi:hypothetical protein
VIGGARFTQLGHRVWLVLAVGGLLAAPFGVAAIRTPVKQSDADPGRPPAELPIEGVSVGEAPQA